MLQIGYGNSTGIGGAGLSDIASYLLLAIMLAVVIAVTLWAYSKTTSIPLRMITMLTDFLLIIPLRNSGQPWAMWIAALLGLAIIGKTVYDTAHNRWDV